VRAWHSRRLLRARTIPGRGRGNQLVLHNDYVTTILAEIVKLRHRRHVELGSAIGTEVNPRS
jgi:hypothetical protein